MASIKRSALVQYSADQMFDLVNDIEKYPEFMLGCVEAVVIDRDDESVVGKLKLSRAGITQEFTTKNLLTRPNLIEMQLVEESSKPSVPNGLLMYSAMMPAKWLCPWILSSILFLLIPQLKNY